MQAASIDIFISYSRRDAAFVDSLAADLAQYGFTVWVDRRKLEGGQDFSAKIGAAIDRCRIMLAVLSPEAVHSRYVNHEHALAAAKGKIIIPILLKPCYPSKLIRSIHWVDFSKNYAAGMQDLLLAFKAQPIAPPHPPSGAPITLHPPEPSPFTLRDRWLNLNKPLFYSVTLLLVASLTVGVVLSKAPHTLRATPHVISGIFSTISALSPNDQPDPMAENHIIQGSDNNLWFTSGNNLNVMTTGGAFLKKTLATPNSVPSSLTNGPRGDASIWFTEAGQAMIGRAPTSLTSIQAYSITSGNQPTGITVGPDHNLWFTEKDGNAIGRMTPTGAVTEFPLPTKNQLPPGIIAGPDGALWFTEPGLSEIGRITTDGKHINEYPLTEAHPGGKFYSPTNLVAADGALWFTEMSGPNIGRVTMNGHITEFPASGNAAQPLLGTWDITAGPGNAVWYTEYSRGSPEKIYRMDLASQAVGAIALPAQNPLTDQLSSSAASSTLATDNDGNLWVLRDNGGDVVKLNPTSAKAQVYLNPAVNSGAQGITSGPNDTIWFAETYGNRVTEMSVTSQIVNAQPLNTTNSQPTSIVWQPGTQTIWFTEANNNALGEFTIGTDSAPKDLPLPDNLANSAPDNIIVGPDHNLWFILTNRQSIGRYILASNTFDAFKLADPTCTPTSLAAGPDGNVWFTAQSCDAIGVLNTNGTQVKSFPLPTTTQPNGADSEPGSLIVGPDHQSFWFVESLANKIGHISLDGQTIQEYPLAANSAPTSITVGADGHLWFTETNADSVGEILPTGKLGRTISVTISGVQTVGPLNIITAPDGNLWFTERFTNTLGQIR